MYMYMYVFTCIINCVSNRRVVPKYNNYTLNTCVIHLQEFEVGAIYPAVVGEVRDYGLMVELAPGVNALLHKSQLSHKYVSACDPMMSLTQWLVP